MPEDEPYDWMTAYEVAALLGVSHWTVRAWCRRGTGPPYYRVGGHSIRYRRSDVTDYRDRCRQPGTAVS